MLKKSPKTSKTSNESPRSVWYLYAMERLVGVVQELSLARDMNTISTIIRNAARNLTGADGATFVLRDGDQCYYADENAIAPLWKGKRFPMSMCISGWVMEYGQSVVIEDIYKDPRIPADAYRPTFVKSLAMVPIRRNSPIGAIGNYWAKNRLPTKEEVAILQALADTASVAIANAELYIQLQHQVHTLEKQQKRIQDQRETLEIFTRALAHDLKEPVRALMSFSRLVQEEDSPPEKRKKYVTFIRDAADRMGMLINTVYHYTQLEESEKTPQELCDMRLVLDGVKENLAHLIQERNAIVDGSVEMAVQANPTHMMQVFQNLVANAIRHNHENIVVQIKAEEQPDYWIFSVRDNGAGIAPEFAEKIFLPFKRLAHTEECAGLGLTICRKIISSYGGKIWCESKPDIGTAFLFTLPKHMEARV